MYSEKLGVLVMKVFLFIFVLLYFVPENLDDVV